MKKFLTAVLLAASVAVLPVGAFAAGARTYPGAQGASAPQYSASSAAGQESSLNNALKAKAPVKEFEPSSFISGGINLKQELAGSGMWTQEQAQANLKIRILFLQTVFDWLDYMESVNRIPPAPIKTWTVLPQQELQRVAGSTMLAGNVYELISKPVNAMERVIAQRTDVKLRTGTPLDINRKDNIFMNGKSLSTMSAGTNLDLAETAKKVRDMVNLELDCVYGDKQLDAQTCFRKKSDMEFELM